MQRIPAAPRRTPLAINDAMPISTADGKPLRVGFVGAVIVEDTRSCIL